MPNINTVKISKRQLKQIIREEKNRLIAETKIRQTIRRVIRESDELLDLDNDNPPTIADLEEITQGMTFNQKVEYFTDFLNNSSTELSPDVLKWIATNFKDEDLYVVIRYYIGFPRYAQKRMRLSSNYQEVHDILKQNTQFELEAYVVAKDPSTTEDVLLQLLDAAEANDWDKVKAAVIEHSATSPELLEEFQEMYPFEVVQNPNTPEKVIRALASHENANIRRKVVSRPDTPSDILMQLVNDPDRKDRANDPMSVRRIVANNPKTPAKGLEQLAYDRKNKYIRIGVAKNPSTSEDTLKYLLDDGVATVRKKAKINLRNRA
jgi:hypothetical protein